MKPSKHIHHSLNLLEGNIVERVALNRVGATAFPKPDLVIYLQAPTDVLLGRIDTRGLPFEQGIERSYLERLNEVYSEFFLYYDDAPLLIVNASVIDLSQDGPDYRQLVDYVLEVRSGRHYFNPTFFG